GAGININGLRRQLHEKVHVIELPDPCIYFEEQVTITEIAQEQTAVTITDKILIVSELEVQVFGGCKIDGTPGIEIIKSCFFKRLIKSNAGYSFISIDPVLHEYRWAFL